MTNKLQGWDYINSLIGKCPICKQRATLGQSANSKVNKWYVCCMTSNCPNLNITNTYKNYYLAINEWNVKYATRGDEDDK